MRFRARAGADQYQLIVDVVQAVHVPGEFLCFHLKPDSLRVVVNQNNVGHRHDITPSFATFDTNTFFFEYRVESRANDEIFLRCDPVQFLRASRSVKAAPETFFKLTQKNGLPRITLEAIMVNGAQVTQDIPIRVLRENGMYAFDEPSVDPPEIRMMLPPDAASLRAVVERLKSFDKFVSVSANISGRLEFETAAASIKIRTIYDGLRAKGPQRIGFRRDVEFERAPTQDGHQRSSSVVKLDSRQLSQALKCTSIRHDRVLLCLSTDNVCILHVTMFNKSGAITLYLPACVRDSEQVLQDDNG
jgi:hypothetical protein